VSGRCACRAAIALAPVAPLQDASRSRVSRGTLSVTALVLCQLWRGKG